MTFNTILLTGAKGQLGNELTIALQPLTKNNGIELLLTDVDTLDICNCEAVMSYCATHRPDIIINCAAYTAVDKAESDKEMAQKLNVEAIGNLAQAAKSINAKIIHISTDYVFDGTAHEPYKESDATSPKSVYGITKAEGEQNLLKICPDAIILRTAWLYSTYGRNFVKTMLSLGEQRDKLTVVADQFGTPTYAADLAAAIVHIMSHTTWEPGIYHFTNSGFATWYDFASAIMLLSHTNCEVLPIATEQYPTPAQRPHYSVLSKQKITDTFGLIPPHWLEALTRCLDKLQNNK